MGGGVELVALSGNVPPYIEFACVKWISGLVHDIAEF